MKRFVLSSENVAKKLAAKQVIAKVFGDDFELVCVSVDSGASDTPTTDDEGIRGALNRIENAKKLVPDADGYLGLEGIITSNSFGTFLCGWAVVEMKNGKIYAGCSAKVQLPLQLVGKLAENPKLSELVAKEYPERARDFPKIGTNGVLTNGLYTRQDEFVDALVCAFGSAKELR
jgi:non-canonical (house-cleaning) NTP pyrophosphatase